ncbi:MAG: hypothetical protein LBG69_08510 [Zoogloeaceae bacterium]|nr:hypothetical protein [Zoogloeaceae bacterium]
MGNILLAHESKTIRATLKAYLKSQHKIQEVEDGDAAWHMLVLHSDLDFVISGPDLGLVSGMELLERLRHNPLDRLKTLPFYFIGSEVRISGLMDAARAAGVSGFMYNSMTRAEILSVLHTQGSAAEKKQSAAEEIDARLVMSGAPILSPEQEQSFDVKKSVPKKATAPAKPASGKSPILKHNVSHSGIMSAKLFEEASARLFAINSKGAVLCFTVERYADIEKNLGVKDAAALVNKLAELTQSRVGSNDLIGLCAPGGFAVASPGNSLEQCDAFAQRLKKSVEAAKIVLHGQSLSIALAFATAARPEDGKLDGAALLDLAKKRLNTRLSGGTR